MKFSLIYLYHIPHVWRLIHSWLGLVFVQESWCLSEIKDEKEESSCPIYCKDHKNRHVDV